MLEYQWSASSMVPCCEKIWRSTTAILAPPILAILKVDQSILPPGMILALANFPDVAPTTGWTCWFGLRCTNHVLSFGKILQRRTAILL